MAMTYASSQSSKNEMANCGAMPLMPVCVLPSWDIQIAPSGDIYHAAPKM